MTEFNNPDSYKTERPDILKFIQRHNSLLDVGCNEGALARSVKSRFPGSSICGIEINQEALDKAEGVFDMSWALDLNNLDSVESALKERKFDIIVIADVLEHLLYPEELLVLLYNHLNSDGYFLISLPNTGHWSTIVNVFKRNWPRNNRGIFDKTHTNIYLYKNIVNFKNIIQNSNFKLLDRKIKFFETNKGNTIQRILNKLIQIVKPIPYIRDFFTFQYIFKIQKR